MFVDFEFKRVPSVRVACLLRVGRWKEDNLRTEFNQLVKWAKKNKTRTGNWFFAERGENRWEACLEIHGRAKGEGRIRIATLPAATVARVVFDPEQVSPRVIYHGLTDWLRWRRKEGEIKSVSSSREVYAGNPWTDRKAWAHAEVQFLVRR